MSSGDSGCQAHFSAKAWVAIHVVACRKVSQTPTCEQLRPVGIGQIVINPGIVGRAPVAAGERSKKSARESGLVNRLGSA
jgi:hypothetical protein